MGLLSGYIVWVAIKGSLAVAVKDSGFGVLRGMV